MDLVRIIFKGKTRDIVNAVDMNTFLKAYKPLGWQLADETAQNTEKEILNELKTEQAILNYDKMKRVKEKKFNDGLFKKGGE